MTRKEHRKARWMADRKIGVVYMSKKGTRLAESRQGKAWLQVSINPPKCVRVFYDNGKWDQRIPQNIGTKILTPSNINDWGACDIEGFLRPDRFM